MKKEKIMKIIALILCAAMMMCMLTACKEDVYEKVEIEDTEETNDFTTIYEHIDADTPVMKIGDVEITWGVMYYYFYQEATTLYAFHGEIYDWTATYQNGQTYLEYCVSEAIYNNLRRIAGIEHFAEEYNVELTEEQLQTIAEEKAADLELLGDEAAMTEYMNEMYLTEETVQYLAESEVLFLNIMDAMSGVEGENLTVEEIRAMADTAYKAIKTVAIPKDAENALANAEAALAALKFSANKEAKIDELIDTYCDPAMAEEYKTGYVFTRGHFDDMAVEEALRGVEKGQLCDSVIEGENYYYVVLRTEVDVDAYPYGYPYYSAANVDSRWGELNLRNLYRDDIFEDKFWGWADSVEVEFYEVLEQLDVEEVLGWN